MAGDRDSVRRSIGYEHTIRAGRPRGTAPPVLAPLSRTLYSSQIPDTSFGEATCCEALLLLRCLQHSCSSRLPSTVAGPCGSLALSLARARTQSYSAVGL